MNKRNIAVIVTAAAAICFTFFFLVFSGTISGKTDEILFEIDSNLSSGYYRQARVLIDKNYKNVKSSGDALSILKRTESYASAADDYPFFRDVAVYYSGRYKRNIEISAVGTYACLKNGNSSEALEISERSLPKSVYSSLYILAALRSGADPDKLKLPEKNRNPVLDIIKTAHSAEEYSDLAVKFGDNRLYINSALMLMKAGKKTEAFTTLDNARLQYPDKLGMYISYDSGNYTRASDLFIRILGKNERLSTEDLLFGCDILIADGKTSLAGDLYREIIESSPDFSYIPYRNLYSIERSYGGIRYLRAGLAFFSSEPVLLKSMAWEAYQGSDYGAMEDILSAVEKGDPEVQLFRLSLSAPGRSPEYITGAFWNIYNLDPDSETTAGAFADYLLRNRLFQQFDLLVQDYNNSYNLSGIMLNYMASASAMRGRYNEALHYLDKSDMNMRSGLTDYNRAVILNYTGKYNEALAYIRSAENSPENIPDENRNTGKIYLKTAEILYNMNAYEEAWNYIIQAENLLPENIRVTLLKKSIQDKK